MKLQELQQEMEKDSKIDFTKLAEESLETSYVIAKWIKYRTYEKLILEKGKSNLHRLKRDKIDYYLGRKPNDVYPIKVLRNEVDIYLDSDEDMIKQLEELTFQQEKVNMIEEFIKVLHARGYAIHNALEARKFEAGVS